MELFISEGIKTNFSVEEEEEVSVLSTYDRERYYTINRFNI